MRRLLLGFLLLALAACAPTETRYRLEPPAEPQSSATRACLATCSQTRAACLEPAEARLAACEDQASLRQNLCEIRARDLFELCSRNNDRTGRSCERRTCWRPLCARTELAACDADYRRCFAACGGSVVEEGA